MSQFQIMNLQFLDHVLFATEIQGGRQLTRERIVPRISTASATASDTTLTTGLRISGNLESGFSVDVVGTASAAAAGAVAASVGGNASAYASANANE